MTKIVKLAWDIVVILAIFRILWDLAWATFDILRGITVRIIKLIRRKK